MRRVIGIYDDTVKPDSDIRSITGSKSFGETIFHRETLKEHTKKIFKASSYIAGVEDDKSAEAILSDICAKDFSILLLYSCFIISDIKAFNVLAEKAVYAHDNYKVTCGGKIACVIIGKGQDYFTIDPTGYDAFDEIECGAFTDISDVNNFRQFITSGFEARFFNAVSGDDYTVVKKSANAKKLKAEYTFYSLLPDSMKQWFVMPYDYTENGGVASYRMERFHMADLAIRYVHGAISTDEFEDILNRLFYFIGKRVLKEVTPDEYSKKAEELYIKKVDDRISELKQQKEFAGLKKLIADSTDYNGIDDIINDYKAVYQKIRGGKNFKNVLVVGHGDLCFSNILYNHDAAIIKFIDPKGAMEEAELYTDPYYDVAKLSHSVCGYYDYFNSDLYEITFDEKLKARLNIDFDNSDYIRMFREKLEGCGLDYRLVRLYECSLFLSMLPLHIDRPKKVFAFVLNAINILNMLKEG